MEILFENHVSKWCMEKMYACYVWKYVGDILYAIAVWKYCMEVMCGNRVWTSCMEVTCGHPWKSCMEIMYGNLLGKPCMEIVHENLVWISVWKLEAQAGDQSWRPKLERMIQWENDWMREWGNERDLGYWGNWERTGWRQLGEPPGAGCNHPPLRSWVRTL